MRFALRYTYAHINWRFLYQAIANVCINVCVQQLAAHGRLGLL